MWISPRFRKSHCGIAKITQKENFAVSVLRLAPRVQDKCVIDRSADHKVNTFELLKHRLDSKSARFSEGTFGLELIDGVHKAWAVRLAAT